MVSKTTFLVLLQAFNIFQITLAPVACLKISVNTSHSSEVQPHRAMKVVWITSWNEAKRKFIRPLINKFSRSSSNREKRRFWLPNLPSCKLMERPSTLLSTLDQIWTPLKDNRRLSLWSLNWASNDTLQLSNYSTTVRTRYNYWRWPKNLT